MTRSIYSWRVITLLALLSLLLTWPLLPHILTHVPGDGIDDPGLAWNLWWIKDSWVDRAGMDGLMHNPFDADVMFYPISINLAFYTLTLLNGALSIPLQSAISLILTNNLLLLSSFVIGGFGTYLLTLELLAHSRIQASGDNSDPPASAPSAVAQDRPATSGSHPCRTALRLRLGQTLLRFPGTIQYRLVTVAALFSAVSGARPAPAPALAKRLHDGAFPAAPDLGGTDLRHIWGAADCHCYDWGGALCGVGWDVRIED